LLLHNAPPCEGAVDWRTSSKLGIPPCLPFRLRNRSVW
jgi:hypothetical protein